MGGLQLLSIGLIGEYLAHVFEEVKGRPKYLFKVVIAMIDTIFIYWARRVFRQGHVSEAAAA